MAKKKTSVQYERTRTAAQTTRREAARRGWETRWENGKAIGKKGEKYLKDKYDIPDDWIEAPIFDDEWEIDY